MTSSTVGDLRSGHRVQRHRFLHHVEGTRAVAVLLVLGYHLFSEQSAGAVDVFFVLTGFLVVSSLLRKYDRGLTGIREFLTGLFLRLAPVSLVVLFGVYLGSIFFLPKVGINGVFREIIASALYLENWQLVLQGSDYLNRSTPPSPVLHFWAMSVQMQFYLLTVAIFVLALLFVPRRADGSAPIRALAAVLSVAFAASFAYSIYLTYGVSAQWAYFDTLARFWEFLIGAFLGMALTVWPHLRLHWSWGWVGLLGLLLAGAVVGVYQPFPGYAALVPTLSTVLIILAGMTPSALSANRLLSSRAMVSLGGVAYTLYLVHWPILIFYRESVSPHVTWRAGLAIFAVSVAFSYLLRAWVERPLLKRKYGGRPGLLLAWTAIPLAVLTVGAPALSIATTSLRVAPGSFLGTVNTFAPTSALSGEDWYPKAVDPDLVTPPFELVETSVPAVYEDLSHLGLPCHVKRSNREAPAWCAYGNTRNPSHTIALVGASHAAQWLPALDVLGQRNGWRIITLTAADCNFLSEHATRSPYIGCDPVAEEMLRGIMEVQPDLVITTANTTTSSQPEPERIAPWVILGEGGIPVVALRDNPSFETAPSRCVSLHLDDPVSCATERESVLSSEFDLGGAPDTVTLVDMTDQYCDDLLCPAIIGNTLLWRDNDHFTSEFVVSMADVLETRLLEAWNPPTTSRVRPEALRGLIPTLP